MTNNSNQGFSEKPGISGKSDLHVLNKQKSKSKTSKVKIKPIPEIDAKKFFEGLYDKSDDNPKLLIDSGIWDLTGINFISIEESIKNKNKFILDNPSTDKYMVVETYEVDEVFFLSDSPKKFTGIVKGIPTKEDIGFGVAGINMILDNTPSRILIVGQNDWGLSWVR